jgi:two-component system, cell cycle sensor histidine kinase and response regulator CckA
MPETKTRILHVEDEPLDSELVGLWLTEAGMDSDIVRVESRDAFVSALTQGGFDIVISDYGLPSFDGLEALRETRRRRPDLAFVFFTATLGEERAVEAPKAGATDFVAKGRPDRLPPAVRRALKEVEERSARKQAEETLKAKEVSFRLLFESNPHPMWVSDRHTRRFLEVNTAAVEHYGYSREEFLGMRVTDIRPPDEVRQVEEPARAEEERDAQVARRSGPWPHKTKDGRLIDVEVVAHDIEFGGRPGRLVVAHDVTERKRLEAQLLQSQKLEAIGQLAAGVAHDFNNLLNVITGYSHLLLRGLPADGPEAGRVEQISRAADRGAALTRQLLAFSRRQVLEPRIVDLNGVLAEVQSMLRRLIGENIEIVTNLDPGLGRVKADPCQMEQVLVNLAVNARDAMPQGGRLILQTANVDPDGACSSSGRGACSGGHVGLLVSDTGHGMDAPTVSRIFEPFFTTKPRGRGTGLGLATVYGIIQQSGGHIEVQSQLDHGTTFKIYLPRVHQDAAAPEAGNPGTAPTPRGTETILLVEDEAALRTLIRDILEESGYVVLEAADPEAGLFAASSHRGAIHLLVADMMLPQMSGSELAEHLRAARPDIALLFMSGYTDETVRQQAAIAPGTHFLQKPFTPPDLLRTVRVVLKDLKVPDN